VSAETVLYAALTAAAGVTALIGTRVYPDVVPQESALPCAAFARLDTEYTTTIHSGVPIAENTTIEISCMALTRASADDVCNAVIAAAGAAGFTPTGRRAEFDSDQQLWATVLTVDYLASL